MPYRSRKVILLSHCILNTNVRAQGLVLNPLHRAMASGLVSTLARLDYGLIQLPCPELEYFGAIRSEMASREYLRRIDDLADRVVETIYA